MEVFSYKGISAGKYVEGEIEALNQDEASFKLKEQKLIITNLIKTKKKKGEKKEKTKGKSSGLSLFGKKKVKVEEILIFSKQFATMVKAGLPILQTLAMLRDQLESPAIKEVIEDIRKGLEGGVTLSKNFEKYPQYFDNVYVNLIKAGEASGKLDVFLLKIVDDLEKKEKIKKKIKGALMYPGIMFTTAMVVSAFMLVKVVPVFAEMYEGMGIALPKPTAVIMSMSIDAVDHKIDYIRHGSDWDIISENTQRYAEFCTVDVTPTTSVLNAIYDDEIREYCAKNRFKIYDNLLITPYWLHVKNAPDELKKKFTGNIAKWADVDADPEWQDKFREYITKLDNWRGMHIKDYLPEVAKAYGLD